MDRSEFWHSDDDEAVLAAYLSEHSFEMSFDAIAGELAIQFGDVDRLPERVFVCAGCGTEVKERGSAGWRHEVGFNARNGCTQVTPRLLTNEQGDRQ